MRISELPDGEYVWEIKPYKPKRSNQQNAYYWAVIVPLVEKGLRDIGFDEIRDAEDAHEAIKSLFFKKILHNETHEELTIETVTSTTKFSKEEFSEKIDMIIKWAWEYLAVSIPLPNSQAAMDFGGYDEPDPGIQKIDINEL